MNIEDIKSVSFTNEEYKDSWIKYVPNTNERYCDGTVVTETQDTSWCVYDGATNALAWIDKTTGEVEYNGERDEYKETFVKYAKKAINM